MLWIRPSLVGGVLLAALLLPGNAAGDTNHHLTVVSRTGTPWIARDGSVGTTVLIFGNIGCTTIDAAGFCTSGVWPTIAGAHWVWKTQTLSVQEAITGEPRIVFPRSFRLPRDASNISGTVRITADDAYRVILNGTRVGADGTLAVHPPVRTQFWETVETWPIHPHAGLNHLRIKVVNFSTDGFSPFDGPAGLTYRVDVSYATPG